jgi:hypothetical protein
LLGKLWVTPGTVAAGANFALAEIVQAALSGSAERPPFQGRRSLGRSGEIMFRKMLGVSAVFLLSVTLVTVVDSAVVSAMPNPPASGTLQCNISGNGKFAPKLTAAGLAVTAVKTKFKGVGSGCTGTATTTNSAGTTSPVTIPNVKIKGAGYIQPTGPGNANACAVFTASDGVGMIKVKITYPGAAPAIAPTVVTYSVGGPYVSNNAGSDRLSLPSGATTTITGSFATASNAQITLDTLIVNLCSSTWGPYSTFTFGPTSLLNIF